MGNIGFSELLLIVGLGIVPAAVGVGLVVWGVRTLAEIRREVAALRKRMDALDRSGTGR